MFKYLKVLDQANSQVPLQVSGRLGFLESGALSQKVDRIGKANPSRQQSSLLFPPLALTSLCHEESAGQARQHPAFKSKLRLPSSHPINSYILTAYLARDGPWGEGMLWKQELEFWVLRVWPLRGEREPQIDTAPCPYSPSALL